MKIFHHASDLDGRCCGAILLRAYPNCELYPYNYWYDPETYIDIVQKDEPVIFADITPTPPNLERLMNITENITIIDHHSSSFDDLESLGLQFPGIMTRDGLGACALVWEWCQKDRPHPKPVPFGVQCIAEYDAWERKTDNIRFHYGIQTFNTFPTNWIWDEILKDDQKTLSVILRSGRAISDYLTSWYKRQVRSYAIEGRVAYTRGDKIVEYPAIFINQGGVDSSIFDSLEKKYDVYIRGTFGKARRWSISITTESEDVDVSMIARDFEGGGHVKAAGMVVDDLSDFFIPDEGYINRYQSLPKSDVIHP